MAQLTLNGTLKTVEPVQVPIYIYHGKSEATDLARLIVEVKPKYLFNLSNSIEALRNHIKRNVENNTVFIMDSETVTEVTADYDLAKKVRIIEFY